MSMPGQTAARTSVRGVLFDMDGVLIDSTGADEQAWKKWAVFQGMQGSFSIQSTHGRRAVDTIRVLRQDLDPMVEARRLEAFDAEATKGITALPGAQNILAKLTASPWAIVTSASDALMRRRLESAGIAIPPTVVTADDVSRGKPNPEPYEIAAARLGLAPAECLVIEDSPNGIRAGKLGGCQVLAVMGSHSPNDLHEADWTVESLDCVRVTVADDGWVHFQFDKGAI